MVFTETVREAMNELTKFSVLMSIYSNEKVEHLVSSLDSIFSQSLLPHQIVLVIDGPIPSELQCTINEYQHNSSIEFTTHRIDTNVGLGNALNVGVGLCKYPIIARMDTDDIAHIDRFKNQIPLLAIYDVVGSTVEEFRNIPGDYNKIRSVPEYSSEILKFARFRNPINHPTIIFKKSVYDSIGGYRSVLSFEDYDFILRIIKHGYSIYNFQQPLLYFRFNVDTYKRRRGLGYALKEFRFYWNVIVDHLLPYKYSILMLAVKPIIRLFPTSVIKYIYISSLRNDK